jgi:hypothetical protein
VVFDFIRGLRVLYISSFWEIFREFVWWCYLSTRLLLHVSDIRSERALSSSPHSQSRYTQRYTIFTNGQSTLRTLSTHCTERISFYWAKTGSSPRCYFGSSPKENLYLCHLHSVIPLCLHRSKFYFLKEDGGSTRRFITYWNLSKFVTCVAFSVSVCSL